MKQKLKTGDEVDAVCAKDMYHWASGVRKKIKRQLNKRFRKEGKKQDDQTK